MGGKLCGAGRWAVVAATVAAAGSVAVANTDCNNNGIPDAVEIAAGLVEDCNGNGVPDACEYAGVELNADQSPFGGGAPLVATFTEVEPAVSDVRFDIEVRADLGTTTRFVTVRVGSGTVASLWVIGGAACPATPSVASVIVPAATFNAAAAKGVVVISLEPSLPVSVKACALSFASLQVGYVTDGEFEDCLGNGIWDACEIAENPSLDCNGNGVLDACEIAGNPSLDCDGNGLIDACEFAADPFRDCNGNGILDACEIAVNPRLDCDGDGAIDACAIAGNSSLDCNQSGVLDACEIALQPVRDCNANGVLDECELAQDPTLDTSGDGFLDACHYRLGDFNLDGLVDGGDLGVLLALWGLTEPKIGDLNGDGLVDGGDLGVLLSNWGPVPIPPVILTIDPPGSPLGGGQTITITGLRLGTVQSITVGGVPASGIVVVDVDTVSAVTPPGTAFGPVEISVTTAFGTATLPSGFVYAPIPAWATLLELSPDPSVVTNATLRNAIVATGLPWRVRDTASQIEMLLVPPGTFMMGCSPSLQYFCNSPEYPVHQVTLTQPFYLGRYEVTQAQWTAVMGSNPSQFQSPSAQVPADQVPNRPVERVSWNMIQSFNAVTGLRLPTEAEWEYACRAGTATAFNLPPNGTNDDDLLDQLGWINVNSASQTRPVGQKQANNLGFFDMHGNVWELVQDWYSGFYYSQSPGIDPPGPMSGSSRVMRGGSWHGYSVSWTVSRRNGISPGLVYDYGAGFRAARTP